MFEDFFDSICRVGIFVMCAQTIVHFKPKEVYEKYLRYLVSIMVLIQLFLPLSGFLLGGGRGEIDKALSRFEEELKSGMELAEESAREADEKLESMTLEEVRKQLEQQSVDEEQINSENQETIQSGQDVTDENISVEVEKIDPIVVGD